MTELTKGSKIKKPKVVNNLIIVRGLPGSGKSTVAGLFNGPDVFKASTDDWFVKMDGKYRFNPADLEDNHKACIQWYKDKVDNRNKSKNGITIVIHNTFTKYWELYPYVEYIKNKKSFLLTVLDVFDGGLSDKELFLRNIHGVPKEKIEEMRENLESSKWCKKRYKFYVEGREAQGERWA